MPEKRTKMSAVQITCICDECGEGEMTPTGVSLMSNPPQFPHWCDKCGATINVVGSPYPRIEWVPEEDQSGES